MEYAKLWLSYDEQADRLAERGLDFDRDDLVEHLADVGYYRLSGYWCHWHCHWHGAVGSPERRLVPHWQPPVLVNPGGRGDGGTVIHRAGG